MYRYKILIVDDDKLLQASLDDILSESYDTLIAGSGEEALRLLKSRSVDLVMLDIRLPGINGIETLRRMKEMGGETVVIMMTAYEDVKSVISSMKMGAFDYLVKPLDIEELEIIIEKALENLKLKREVEELRRQFVKEYNLDNIVAQSNSMRLALRLADTIARSHDTTVLIEGETGTGKEVIARFIHHRSSRFNKPFVNINCGAITKELVESELFGYEKGSFTGGLQEGKRGKFETADGGSILLDEISELLPATQVKLLTFLEEKAFYPVGGSEKRHVDVRIIAATNKSLEEGIREGTFREDLFYRLNVARITIPPLRERQADILPLALFFMDKFNEKFRKQFRTISEEARRLLLEHPWTGNVREIRNVIERVVLMETGDEIEPGHLAFMKKSFGDAATAARAIRLPATGLNLDELTKDLILQALERTGGHRGRAAKLLGISRPTMIYRIEKYGIKV
ncbi:MAG: sigma-54 dependent transcriptional regulator [Pseudomonadota bacterium]|jgi:DNA-binding NtrC family response regulator|nr:sigma-54-dependent Fis family transcriptional regulator [Syntrophaceae bacterium]MBP7033123.1 sigma-54-dependent Fis family transcriptional regulator [Syntrophobacterales bacterium]MDI9554716.1 sigma-54 dependent transcriptional regulator [Pseudomonadota bacterium]NLX30679.1 sigma-54-dependent Fis family transcriptional regulator [Deltaproteobacteria bacterium]HNU84596.1 sigma-54 dependent transcriptional regulator [Syntrophales bacterium]